MKADEAMEIEHCLREIWAAAASTHTVPAPVAERVANNLRACRKILARVLVPAGVGEYLTWPKERGKKK